MNKIHPIRTMTSVVIGILLLSAISFSVSGQQSYTYRFAALPITSTPPGGPVMVPIGSTMTPVARVIPASTCADMPTIDLTYFSRNAGFKAKSFFTGQYSIEMIFRFSELDGYNRIIDFSNSVSDNGIYTFSDCLNFYPSGNIGPCPAFDTTNYIQMVITRNQGTKEMNIYVNGELFTTYIDDSDYYVIGAAPMDSITFFKDDLSVGNEASPGNVALIRMTDFELTPQAIEESYTDFCDRLTGTAAFLPIRDIAIYPNPASDHVTIDLPDIVLSKDIAVSVFNMLGQEMQHVIGNNEVIALDVTDFPSGLYTYQLHAAHQMVGVGSFLKK